MSPDQEHYDASQLDWPALLEYAQLAAAITPLPPATRWLHFRPKVETVVVERRVRGFLGFPRWATVVEDRHRLHPCPILGPHWILDARSWSVDERRTDGPEQVRELTRRFHRLALLPDGRLVAAGWSETKTWASWGRSPAGRPVVHVEHQVVDAGTADVLDLDYDKRRRRIYLGGTSAVGDLARGAKLVHPVKGAGLTRVLEDLSRGRVVHRSPTVMRSA